MADPTSLNGLVGDPRALPDNMGIAPTDQAIKPSPQPGKGPAGRVENMGPGSMALPEGPSDGPVSGGGATNSDPSLATRSNVVSGVNVGAQSASIANDASGFISGIGANLSDQVPDINPDAEGTNIDGTQYDMEAGGLNQATNTAAVDTASQVSTDNQASTYDATTTSGEVADNLAEAATMDANEDAIIDADELTMDMQGMATGINEDGSINATGAALNEFAHQNISRVIDTSTVSGKLLAQTLGEGNYTDAKATVKGQLDILTKEFVDSEGNPKIPSWAAGIARNVGRTFAFKGVTGTAAMSAMSTAMIEATLPIAQADSQFYQTLTIKNLDNKQQMLINKANVLSKMELANLDVRTATAVNNAKTFMQYDMKNLDNEQQANIINSQNMIQSILEDAKQVNVARRFNAESQNDMDMFYDNLSASIDMYNTGQKNQNAMFNTGQVNDMRQFNANLENSREQFYLDMQFNIDKSNAAWRQTVTLTETEMAFNAAATDVKNILNLTSEAMNQLWDRADSLLDYAWKSGENQKDREANLELAKLQAESARRSAKANAKAGMWSGIGSAAGMIGAALISDERLKTDIVERGELPNGVKLYSWNWTEKAKSKGADKYANIGVLAQQVEKVKPENVIKGSDGYKKVNYRGIYK